MSQEPELSQFAIFKGSKGMSKKIGASWMALVVFGLILLGGCAFQDDLVTVNDRVISLEREKASLRSEVESYQEERTKSGKKDL